MEPDDADLAVWGTQSVEAEALMLYAMLGRNGDTPETIRELIAVPPRIEAALRTYAEKHRADHQGIEQVLEFRRRVARSLSD